METLNPGTIIGDRYVVESTLGMGGFGTVYKARHRHMNRVVAVKLLDRLTGRTNADVLSKRFVREAESAAKIDHPNVVTIYDFGFYGDDNVPYIAMQLLDGRDLRDEIDDRGPMPAARALGLVLGCLPGLAEAHSKGIVHKDLKPNNLILVKREDGSEYLSIVDFGLATFAEGTQEEESRITTTGHVLGTPRYLSPEYIRDQTATPALDVYQMGLILLEMLTGEPVVVGDNMYNNILAHCSGSLEVPLGLVNSPLGPVLRRALAFDHERRYRDATAFAAALATVDPATLPPAPDLSQRVPLKDISDDVTEDSRQLPLDIAPETNAAARPSIGGMVGMGLAVLALLVLVGVGIGAYIAWEGGSPDPEVLSSAVPTNADEPPTDEPSMDEPSAREEPAPPAVEIPAEPATDAADAPRVAGADDAAGDKGPGEGGVDDGAEPAAKAPPRRKAARKKVEAAPTAKPVRLKVVD